MVRLCAASVRRPDLRIMSNRAGQYVLPFGVDLVAAAAIAAAAGAVAWRQPAP